MTEHDAGDLEALHGKYAEVEQVHVTEDAYGIPSWIKVERERMHVVIVPRLLVPRAAAVQTPADPGEATTPAAPCHLASGDVRDAQDETRADALHRQGVAP